MVKIRIHIQDFVPFFFYSFITGALFSPPPPPHHSFHSNGSVSKWLRMCYWLDDLNNKYVKLFPENECCEMGCRLRPKLWWLTELWLRRCVLQKSLPGHDLMLVTPFKILRVDTLGAYNQNVLGEVTLQHRRAFSVSNIWALFNLKMELPVFWKMCAMISMCSSVQLWNGRGITAREAHLYLAVLPKKRLGRHLQ